MDWATGDSLTFPYQVGTVLPTVLDFYFIIIRCIIIELLSHVDLLSSNPL